MNNPIDDNLMLFAGIIVLYVFAYLLYSRWLYVYDKYNLFQWLFIEKAVQAKRKDKWW